MLMQMNQTLTNGFNNTNYKQKGANEKPKLAQFQNMYIGRTSEIAGISPQEMVAYYQNAANTKNIMNAKRK